MPKGNWTTEAVFYFFTTEHERWRQNMPDAVAEEYSRRIPKLMQRYPQVYCSKPEEKYRFRHNKDWLLTHSKVVAKILNEMGVPTWIMGELTHPCPVNHGPESASLQEHCKTCWGLGRVP